MSKDKWTCKRCRDRGVVRGGAPGGEVVEHPCPECSGQDEYDNTLHPIAQSDKGDGLPTPDSLYFAR